MAEEEQQEKLEEKPESAQAAEQPPTEAIDQSLEDGGFDLEAVYDIPLDITVVLGTTTISIDRLTQLSKGSVVELDRRVGEPVDVYVNDRLVARGEVVIVEESVGITLTEVIKTE